MPASVQTAQSTEWPEGVIARYLTKAAEISGLLVSVDLTQEKTDTDSYTTARCGGCGSGKSCSWATEIHGSHGYYTIQDWMKGDSGAREWAQAHAEKCRALPRPTA